jgi:hypothetical protein
MSFLFKSGKKKTKDIVRRWEKEQISNIARELGKIIPQQAPFLRDVAVSSLVNLISKNLEFSAGEPEEISRNIYSVKDTVRVRIGPDIPFIGKQFSLSINYTLKVDVKDKKVVESMLDISSLKISFV